MDATTTALYGLGKPSKLKLDIEKWLSKTN